MDVLTFTANVIGSLAWPGAALITLFVLLRHGQKIARFVKSFKFKDVEVTFRDEFEKAKSIAYEVQVENPVALESERPAEVESEVVKLAKIDPGVAILKSWQRLEAALTRMIQYNGLARLASPDRFVTRLVQLQMLTPTDAELYKRLRRIRNEAVHLHRSLTIAEAVEYDQLVETLNKRLGQVQSIQVSGGAGYVDME